MHTKTLLATKVIKKINFRKAHKTSERCEKKFAKNECKGEM